MCARRRRARPLRSLYGVKEKVVENVEVMKTVQAVEEGEGADLVALGTAVGALLLYSAK